MSNGLRLFPPNARGVLELSSHERYTFCVPFAISLLRLHYLSSGLHHCLSRRVGDEICAAIVSAYLEDYKTDTERSEVVGKLVTRFYKVFNVA